MKDIYSYVDWFEDQYINNPVTIEEGLLFSQRDTLRTVTFYLSSKYLSGDKDELGKDKPFMNINVFRKNVAFRATEIDIKDIKVVADGVTGYDEAFLLGKGMYEWMKDTNHSEFLNDFTDIRPSDGSVCVKKVMRDGVLTLELPLLKNLVTDRVDMNSGTVIETHYLLPEEFMSMSETWDMGSKSLDDILEEAQKQRDYDGRIKVKEVHGVFPDSYIEGGEDGKYTRQCHYIVCAKKEYDVYQEYEEESPYRFLPWRKRPGLPNGLGVGVVEDGFEAQTWVNDAVMKEHRMMEILSRVIVKSTVKNAGNNIITDYDNGQIIELQDGAEFSKVDLTPSSLPELGNLVKRWDDQYERVSSTFNAITGEQMPSGTPYRQTAILNQEAGSLFDCRREEAGIFLSKIYMDWVIPYIIDVYNNKGEITSDYFSKEELQMLDEAFAANKANNKTLEDILGGELVDDNLIAGYENVFNKAISEQKKTGSMRSLKIPKGYFKNVKYKVTIDITGEKKNKAVILESLNNILLTIAKNPSILENPMTLNLFTEIMETAGISPVAILGGLKGQADMMKQMQGQSDTQQIIQNEQTQPIA